MAKEKITKKQGARKVSAYNTFIKTEIAKVKKANPEMAHKDVSTKDILKDTLNDKCA
ncbi:hypothetical protein INT48_008255, partial [Thamnidium elegans]